MLLLYQTDLLLQSSLHELRLYNSLLHILIRNHIHVLNGRRRLLHRLLLLLHLLLNSPAASEAQTFQKFLLLSLQRRNLGLSASCLRVLLLVSLALLLYSLKAAAHVFELEVSAGLRVGVLLPRVVVVVDTLVVDEVVAPRIAAWGCPALSRCRRVVVIIVVVLVVIMGALEVKQVVIFV